MPSENKHVRLVEFICKCFSLSTIKTDLCPPLEIVFDNLEGTTLKAKADSMVTACEQDERLRDLEELLRELRTTLYEQSFPQNPLQEPSRRPNSRIPDKPSKNAYTFENQTTIIGEIKERLIEYPYLHLYGPTGIGKTYLTLELLNNHFQKHPRAYINFADEQHKTIRKLKYLLLTIVEQIRDEDFPFKPDESDLIKELARLIHQHGCYCIIVLDEADRALNEMLEDLRKILSKLEDEVVAPELFVRFVIVARTERDVLKGRDLIPIPSLRMEEFQEIHAYKRLLKQAYEKWTKKEVDLNDPFINKRFNLWANDLHRITYGYPCAIEQVLDYVGKEKNFTWGMKFDDDFIKEICDEVISLLVNEEMQTQIRHSDLRNAFCSLWIFRYLLKRPVFRRLLIRIRDDKSLQNEWAGLYNAANEDDYDTTATKYPLWERIARNATVFFQPSSFEALPKQLSSLWRKLSNLTLYMNNVDMYHRKHRVAREFYQELAIADSPEEASVQHLYFIEEIYHFCQETWKESPLDEERQHFTEKVMSRTANFLEHLKDSYSSLSDRNIAIADLLDNMRLAIRRDTEVKEALNHSGSSDLYDRLLELVEGELDEYRT